jgi:hypothetical protein
MAILAWVQPKLRALPLLLFMALACSVLTRAATPTVSSTPAPAVAVTGQFDCDGAEGGLSAARLAAAITQAVGDPKIGRRASALGRVIAAEDGLGRAVALVEQALAT